MTDTTRSRADTARAGGTRADRAPGGGRRAGARGDDPADGDPGGDQPGGNHSGGRGRRGSGPAVMLVAVLSAVVVALVVAGTVLLILRHGLRSQQSVREDVLNAARQQALNIVSLDSRTVDRDYDRMLAGTVDPLRSELAKNRATAKDALARSKGISTGTVTDAGLIELQGDKASAVVILDTVQTNTVTKSTVTHRFRFQLDLSRQGGQWLVSNLQSIDICSSGSASEPGCGATTGASASPTPSPKPTTKR